MGPESKDAGPGAGWGDKAGNEGGTLRLECFRRGHGRGGSPRETDANVIALLCGIQTIAFAETENRLQWLAG